MSELAQIKSKLKEMLQTSRASEETGNLTSPFSSQCNCHSAAGLVSHMLARVMQLHGCPAVERASSRAIEKTGILESLVWPRYT